MKRDYVDVIYNEIAKPYGLYPKYLTSYIAKRFNFFPKQKLLEVGCGRGEFANGFMSLGLDVYCVDKSSAAKKLYPKLKLEEINLEDDSIPFPDNFFDIVYSKSVVEHFYFPEKIFKEMYRVLKPGGTLITLCPDWEVNYKIYFEDFTHRTPFMKTSLRDIQLMCGFTEVKVFKFTQLPIVWNAENFFKIFTEATRLFIPDYFKKYSKWVRFSKETMLFSSSVKPKV